MARSPCSPGSFPLLLMMLLDEVVPIRQCSQGPHELAERNSYSIPKLPIAVQEEAVGTKLEFRPQGIAAGKDIWDSCR
jgi:hypothetical protein